MTKRHPNVNKKREEVYRFDNDQAIQNFLISQEFPGGGLFYWATYEKPGRFP
jgi:hypothetical protein